jgi:TRAP transporter TAXI family solute receptor
MHHSSKKKRFRLVNTLIETFGFSPWLATAIALFLGLLLAGAAVWIWLSAPPRHITITSGPPGSTFERYAKAYQEALAEEHIDLKILPSAGSLENLRRLELSLQNVELGFVQSGLAGDPPPPYLVSLGSVAYQPLFIFYRGATKIVRLSELAGKKLGVGAKGSGTNVLALALLEANLITGAPTTFVENNPATATDDLREGRLDAVFLMGDSAPTAILRDLVRNPDVQLYSFAQAEAYIRRAQFQYLNKIVLPRGSFDVGKDLPPQDITLIGPTVELVANKDLNSALSDKLLEKAREVHGKASLIAKKGEFPAPLDHGIPISSDATRFYKSGIGFTYKIIPSFWLANLANRLAVAIVPLILVLIPTLRILPIAYRWSVQLRIYRCYRPLLRLEREAKNAKSPEHAQELLDWLDEIEQDVNALKVPASFAYQFYALRGHVAFVRSRLKAALSA